MRKLINLFKKKKKVPPCPVCGAPAEWDKWIVLPKNEVRKEDYILVAIRCSKIHCVSTSYWRLEDQALYQWQRIREKYLINSK